MKIILRLESSITLIFNTRTKKKALKSDLVSMRNRTKMRKKKSITFAMLFFFVTSSGVKPETFRAVI